MQRIDKRERLLNLVANLLHTERLLSADEIRERVPGYDAEADLATFRRAFERDKDDLREMGVPISVGEIEFRDPPVLGYRIRRSDYYLDAPSLDPDELAALRLAMAAVRLDGLDADDALLRLGGIEESESAAGPIGELATVPTSPAVLAAFAAISEGHGLRFGYRSEQRLVDPERLDFRNGHWYLSGWDRDRKAPRVFRVDRMDDEPVQVPGEAHPSSAADAGQPVQPWEFDQDGDEPVTARLLVEADHVPWALHALGEHLVSERRDDGSVVVELRVANRSNFRSFVVQFLEHAEVLSPQELREDLCSWLESVP